MDRILIVDDDDQLRQSFKRLLGEAGYEILTAPSGESALPLLDTGRPDLIIADIRLPGMNGLELFTAVRKRHPKLPVIIMTAFGTTNSAIEATKLGAFDYVLKPFEIPDMLELIGQALEAGRFMRSKVRLDHDPGRSTGEDVIIGRSKPMQELYKAIGRAAPTDATVLIRGESGTGKELVARAVYQHSLRGERPFLIINCVAIPENLLESELFGYEKGAFTGAVSRRIGKIEQANGGTVFLDEIGDMPHSIQAKILRLLQEKSIERLGGRTTIQVDVRIIAATNRDLETAIAGGRFREDLFYRLNVVALKLPPLRERIEDVPLLTDYFLSRLAGEMGVRNPGLTPKAENLLRNHYFPGNVRELANLLEKAIIFARGRPIEAEDLFDGSDHSNREMNRRIETEEVENLIRLWARQALREKPGQDLFNSLTDSFCSLVISEALTLNDGNRTQTAKILGLSRPTLLAKMEKYGLKTVAVVKKR